MREGPMKITRRTALAILAGGIASTGIAAAAVSSFSNEDLVRVTLERYFGPLNMRIEHLQQFFKNRQLKYTLVLEENQNEDNGPKEKPLSSREQYLKMIEMYPAIKDLKDQLGLELDY